LIYAQLGLHPFRDLIHNRELRARCSASATLQFGGAVLRCRYPVRGDAKMTDAERDAIHEHILRLKDSDRRLSESLLNAMQEREMLLRWMKSAGHASTVPSCHDFGDELLTIQ
jgi:hypothetical protein